MALSNYRVGAVVAVSDMNLAKDLNDLEEVVDDLTANGVGFERYDQPPIATDEKGIAVLGSSKGAWFKDPDGNTLGLLQN
jgi:hypothetical protein